MTAVCGFILATKSRILNSACDLVPGARWQRLRLQHRHQTFLAQLFRLCSERRIGRRYKQSGARIVAQETHVRIGLAQDRKRSRNRFIRAPTCSIQPAGLAEARPVHVRSCSAFAVARSDEHGALQAHLDARTQPTGQVPMRRDPRQAVSFIGRRSPLSTRTADRRNAQTPFDTGGARTGRRHFLTADA